MLNGEEAFGTAEIELPNSTLEQLTSFFDQEARKRKKVNKQIVQIKRHGQPVFDPTKKVWKIRFSEIRIGE